MPKQVTVYSTTRCPYCTTLKNYLTEKQVAFTAYDVGEDRARFLEMREQSGQMGVPVTVIDGQVIVGFDKTALNAALGLG